MAALSKTIHPTSYIMHLLFIHFLLTETFFVYSFFKHPDINECLSAHACQLNERCVNTAGSYSCQRMITCPPGYQIQNSVCEGTAQLITTQAASQHSLLSVVSTEFFSPLWPGARSEGKFVGVLMWLCITVYVFHRIQKDFFCDVVLYKNEHWNKLNILYFRYQDEYLHHCMFTI